MCVSLSAMNSRAPGRANKGLTSFWACSHEAGHDVKCQDKTRQSIQVCSVCTVCKECLADLINVRYSFFPSAD